MTEEKYEMTIDELESVVAFIKSHEREEIPDELWELTMKWCEWLEEQY